MTVFTVSHKGIEKAFQKNSPQSKVLEKIIADLPGADGTKYILFIFLVIMKRSRISSHYTKQREVEERSEEPSNTSLSNFSEGQRKKIKWRGKKTQ